MEFGFNICFHLPTRVHVANNISIGSAVFTGLTIVTEQQTVRQTVRSRYSVCNNRLHLRSTAMRPRNRKELEMWANAQRDGRPAKYR